MFEIDPVETVFGCLLEKSDPSRLFSPIPSPFSLGTAGCNVSALWSYRKLRQLQPWEGIKPCLDVINLAVVKGQLLVEIGDRLLGNRQTELHLIANEVRT